MNNNETADTWPQGMKIVNGHMAHNLREQGMLTDPNSYGYLHLAAEIERPHPLKRNSIAKAGLLEGLKTLAGKLQASGSTDIRRVDVFNAFIIPPGASAGRRVIDEAGYDVHVAAFDIAVLVECASTDAALRVRESGAFHV